MTLTSPTALAATELPPATLVTLTAVIVGKFVVPVLVGPVYAAVVNAATPIGGADNIPNLLARARVTLGRRVIRYTSYRRRRNARVELIIKALRHPIRARIAETARLVAARQIIEIRGKRLAAEVIASAVLQARKLVSVIAVTVVKGCFAKVCALLADDAGAVCGGLRMVIVQIILVGRRNTSDRPWWMHMSLQMMYIWRIWHIYTR